jgi:hypothetical protein
VSFAGQRALLRIQRGLRVPFESQDQVKTLLADLTQRLACKCASPYFPPIAPAKSAARFETAVDIARSAMPNIRPMSSAYVPLTENSL